MYKKAICLCCNREFKYYESNSKGLYCSNKCQQKHQRKLNVENGTATIKTIKRYLLENIEKYPYKCSICNIKNWNGKELTLQLDHIDGNPKNNNLNNIRWICPNCHTQTKTWGVNNISEMRKIKLKEGGKKGGFNSSFNKVKFINGIIIDTPA